MPTKDDKNNEKNSLLKILTVIEQGPDARL